MAPVQPAGFRNSSSIADAARRYTRRVDLDVSINSFGARGTLDVGDNSYEIYRLNAVKGAEKLPPYALKVLTENLLRTEDGANITKDHIEPWPTGIRAPSRASRSSSPPPPA